MNDAAGLDIERFFSAYRAQVSESCPDGLSLGLRLWPRLDPQRWSLEWHLPVWLGDPLGLPRDVSNEIVMSNVLGLAAVRLLDDLADGDAEPADRAAATCLADALYAAALAPYSRLLADHPSFWSRLDAWMAEWRSSTLGGHGREACEGQSRREDLASRGAPLKISALGICILAGREADFGRVGACLDHALTAMVLYDHACDWEEDLAAGRWNAFVAAAAGGADRRDRGVTRTRVLAALMAGQAMSRYFARISFELEVARTAARSLNLVALAGHLGALRSTLGTEGAALEAHYGQLGTRAAHLLFPAAAPTAVAGPVP